MLPSGRPRGERRSYFSAMARASVVFPVPLAPAIAILICVWPFGSDTRAVAFSKNTYRAMFFFGCTLNSHQSPEAPAKRHAAIFTSDALLCVLSARLHAALQHDGCVLFGLGRAFLVLLRNRALALSLSAKSLRVDYVTTAGATRGSCSSPEPIAQGPTASGPPDPLH